MNSFKFSYGKQIQSGKQILIDRTKLTTPAGIILGLPGTGKSQIVKNEIKQILDKTDNTQVFIISTGKDYVRFAEQNGGQVIKPCSGINTFLNPLDLNIPKYCGDNYDTILSEKSDFVISFLQTAMKTGTLNAYAKRIIDTVVKKLYQPYIHDLRKRGISMDCDTCPKLNDIYRELRKRKEKEAEKLADGIQIFCDGEVDIFSYPTDIHTDARFIVYDISEIESVFSDMIIFTCLENITNHMNINAGKRCYTWFYVDIGTSFINKLELLQYLSFLWRRSRCLYGIPTLILQDIDDFCNIKDGISIMVASDFTILTKLSEQGQYKVSELYNIPTHKLKYLENNESGTGLVIAGTNVIELWQRSHD